jgi:CRISPR/Cas system type I-B associated protein Csh2 (Cas7 group RAMP superfamily)
MNNIKDELGIFIKDTNKILKIIWEYFENLHSSKLENQEEVNKFIHTYHVPKLN